MRWRGTPPGNMTAIGARGDYLIQYIGRPRLGPVWVLSGIGHDGMSMLALPPDGRPFPTLTDARAFAAGIDELWHVEPQVSGG